jgi:flagellar protein FliT
MLDAAREGDWDRLIEEERRCSALIDGLRRLGEVPLSEPASKAKHGILRKLLADDAEIRTLTQPWLGQLEAMLGASANARRLGDSYGSAA